MTPHRSEVERSVAALLGGGAHDLVVSSESTEEHPWGWVVHLRIRRRTASRASDDMLFRVGPVIVTSNGRVYVTGSGDPLVEFRRALASQHAGRDRKWFSFGARRALRQLAARQVCITFELADRLPRDCWLRTQLR